MGDTEPRRKRLGGGKKRRGSTSSESEPGEGGEEVDEETKRRKAIEKFKARSRKVSTFSFNEGKGVQLIVYRRMLGGKILIICMSTLHFHIAFPGRWDIMLIFAANLKL